MPTTGMLEQRTVRDSEEEPGRVERKGHYMNEKTHMGRSLIQDSFQVYVKIAFILKIL
jgi:hypothetical protein